eukprot:1392173-Alexandrium_andersonii.AAC.2
MAACGTCIPECVALGSETNRRIRTRFNPEHSLHASSTSQFIRKQPGTRPPCSAALPAAAQSSQTTTTPVARPNGRKCNKA